MAFNLKEAVRFSIVPESPEHIKRHLWFPNPTDVLATNPAIMQVIRGHGLHLERFVESGKTVKGDDPRTRIAAERAGAVLVSKTSDSEKPMVMFQRGPFSTEASNFFVVPSAFDRLPVDQLTTYDDMLLHVAADTAFNYVHGNIDPINNQTN